MAAELTNESTHDDITSFVDQIIADRQSDEPQSDAQIIAEERDEPVGERTADDDSGSADTASETVADEDPGENSQPQWLDDDLKAEITAYGIDETSLADFTSREEVERALRIFDKTALNAGRQAMAEGTDGETPKRDTSGRFQKAESPADSAAQSPEEGRYEIGLDTDIYTEDLINEFTNMRDHYESRLAALETRQATNDAQADEQLFDGLVDTLGHADLFGTSGKENSKQLQRRADLHVAVKAQQIGLKVMGKTVEFDQSLVHRVARMVFADDLSKKDWKAKTRKVSKQADSRQGGGATKPSDPPETLREEMRQRYKELNSAG